MPLTSSLSCPLLNQRLALTTDLQKKTKSLVGTDRRDSGNGYGGTYLEMINVGCVTREDEILVASEAYVSLRHSPSPPPPSPAATPLLFQLLLSFPSYLTLNINLTNITTTTPTTTTTTTAITTTTTTISNDNNGNNNTNDGNNNNNNNDNFNNNNVDDNNSYNS